MLGYVRVAFAIGRAGISPMRWQSPMNAAESMRLRRLRR